MDKTEKIDRRKFNGGHPTNGGRPKKIKKPGKVNVTFAQTELDALRNHKTETKEPYNELLRRLVQQHFGIETNF